MKYTNNACNVGILAVIAAADNEKLRNFTPTTVRTSALVREFYAAIETGQLDAFVYTPSILFLRYQQIC